MIITNSEIVGRLKLLADEHLKADSGTKTSVINTTLINGADVSNHFICFISGENIDTDKVITSFDETKGEIFFDTLLTDITSTDEFCLVKTGFQSDVIQAEGVIRNDLRNRGYDLDLFLTEPQLKEMYIYKTIELVCASLMNDGEPHDVYFVQYLRFKELYETEISSLIADYDANQDGIIDGDEESVKLGQIRFSR